ncbi:putative hydrolase [Gordonia effusa NBRC 100432]|uniref:Putative hydrolase n=1 Tax=Gordonia effusa NBRC 100432 TaxID=1077974 RepID=H0QV96_9ACTN|nr:alpha/beta fold hydrolase [Gordonia effusa]GAB16747.1 putative hydrolase [Gordonia effusa NBRC 100432]
MASGYVTTADLEMYYETYGSDDHALPPLLLIHGGGSTIATNWSNILPLLSGDRQVIAIEEEGHGRTRATDRPLTSEASAADIVEVLTALDVGPVDVLAFSAGAQTALALAMSAPARVRRLILASAPWRRDAMIDGFWAGLEQGTLDDMPDLFKDEHRRLNGDDPASVQRLFDLDRGRMLAFTDWLDDDIAAVRMPTLIIAADQDVVTVSGAVRLSTTLAHARLLIVPGNHGDYLGEAMASGDDLTTMHSTAALILNFLS